jgi:DNA-binding response OmpR family regulator
MEMPVIMATGTLPQAEFARSPWLQPAATLLKPYTIAELLRTVKKVLREADSTSDGARFAMPRHVQDGKVLQAAESDDRLRQIPTNGRDRILVVDEDSDLRQLYAATLTVPGYRVDVAEDGAAGWETLQANCYNLLITEHDMPKLNGVELVRKLRAAHMELPVVMAAGRMPYSELARNPSLHLAATLVKPFAVAALLDVVKNVLRVSDEAFEHDTPPVPGSLPSSGGLKC